MTDPASWRRDESLDQPPDNTQFLQGMQQLESLGGDPVPRPEPPLTYAREPLFSRRVLFGYGIATFLVWLTLTSVVPRIIDRVRVAIAEHAMPSENTVTRIQTRNGIVTIRRSENGVTVERSGPEEPAAGQVPAPVPPAEAPPAPPTGKK